ncbi:MAG: NIPSNAP family protein [Acidobacteriia bacterium]|nr:NIPSNAP family protein [Terriglobia bacterium]MBV8906172.1 NIPSNAP family protein [Terriglobia bacterium]
MNRRLFVQSIAGVGALSQAAIAQQASNSTRLYLLDYFYYRQGDQGTRLQQFLSSQMALWTKHSRAFGVFTAVMAPHAQTTLVLAGFSTFEEMTAAQSRIDADSGYQKAREDLDRGNNPAFDSQQRVLLRAAEFSPEIVSLLEKPKQPRYFEIRVYHSPTARQLRLVHERFAGPEIRIFHRSGIHPILYADTIAGPDMDNLTYIIPFASLAEREKAWETFNADPEWVKARAESIERGGQIVDYQNISLWRAAPFSPIQ